MSVCMTQPLQGCSNYRMASTYPLTLEHATDIIEQLRLSPYETIIEPSRLRGYLFDDLGTATAFRLRVRCGTAAVRGCAVRHVGGRRARDRALAWLVWGRV